MNACTSPQHATINGAAVPLPNHIPHISGSSAAVLKTPKHMQGTTCKPRQPDLLQVLAFSQVSETTCMEEKDRVLRRVTMHNVRDWTEGIVGLRGRQTGWGGSM